MGEVERIARELSDGMENALYRLSRGYVWIDGRSERALINRGLAKLNGAGSDELIGSFKVVTLTPLGASVANALRTPDA